MLAAIAFWRRAAASRNFRANCMLSDWKIGSIMWALKGKGRATMKIDPASPWHKV